MYPSGLCEKANVCTKQSKTALDEFEKQLLTIGMEEKTPAGKEKFNPVDI